MNEHIKWLIGIGILLAGWLALRNGIFNTGTQQWQPDGEVVGMFDYGTVMSPVICEPMHNTGDVTYLPVRYPARCGENISTLIMHGFDPLWQNKPADFAWMQRPPSEVSI
jgi:hypothetical protein